MLYVKIIKFLISKLPRSISDEVVVAADSFWLVDSSRRFQFVRKKYEGEF